MEWRFDDGGREAAGYRGSAGDCAVRAVAIASGKPYAEVYEAINLKAKTERPRGKGKRSSAREGVHRRTLHKYLTGLGWKWTPTMGIGTGCKVHLHDGELPSGRLVVVVSRHYTAVVDGEIRDTHDPQRVTVWSDGRISRRCVYGYYQSA